MRWRIFQFFWGLFFNWSLSERVIFSIWFGKEFERLTIAWFIVVGRCYFRFAALGEYHLIGGIWLRETYKAVFSHGEARWSSPCTTQLFCLFCSYFFLILDNLVLGNCMSIMQTFCFYGIKSNLLTSDILIRTKHMASMIHFNLVMIDGVSNGVCSVSTSHNVWWNPEHTRVLFRKLLSLIITLSILIKERLLSRFQMRFLLSIRE